MDTVIDLIYEAGVNAEVWPAVLDAMSDVADAEGGVLFAAGIGRPQWTSSERMRHHMQAFVDEGWAEKNSRSAAAFAKRLNSFSTDHDTLAPELIETDPLYVDFFRPRGLGWSIGTSIVPLTGDVMVVSLERRFDKGPVDEACKPRLDPLRPHLARAALLSARLGLERARTTVVSLEMVGLAAAVIAADGRLIAANRRLEAMKDTIVFRAFNRFSFCDPAAQKSIADVLAAMRKPWTAFDRVMTFPIVRSGEPPRVVHIVPLVASGRDFFRAGDAVMIVADVDGGPVPDAGLLEALFDLTPAEARVAEQVARAKPLRQVASELGIAYETVRTHAQSIFRKTGAGGQAELVRLVGSMPRFGAS